MISELLLPILRRIAFPASLLLSGLLIGAYLAWAATSSRYEQEIAQDKAARQAAVIKAQAREMVKQKEFAKVNTEVLNGYEIGILDMRARYDAEFNRLQLDPQIRGDGLRDSDSCAGSDHGAARPARLPIGVQKRLVELMKQADEQTQRLVACQTFVKKQQEAYGK